MNLDAEQEHGLPGDLDAANGFFDSLGQGSGVAHWFGVQIGRRNRRPHVDHVAGDLDVNWPFEAGAGGEYPVDFAESSERIVELGARATESLEDVVLCAKVSHHVVEQRIVNSLAQAGRTGDHHDGRLLGVSPGDRIANAQAADAVGDAERAHAVDAGIGIGGESGAVFAGAADGLDRALFEHRVERQHVVAGDAEDVADAVVLKAAEKVFAD